MFQVVLLLITLEIRDAGRSLPAVGLVLGARVVPDHLLGRAIGAMQFIANGGMAVGALCAGVVLWMLGTWTTGWILVVGMLVLAAASTLVLQQPKRP